MRREDSRAEFEQKGVDVRIGLDIAAMCERRTIDRILLLSGDKDMVPAMKHARKAGVQVAVIEIPGRELAPDLLAHVDLRRQIQWPEGPESASQGTAAMDTQGEEDPERES